jgi:hypothetical protein
MSSRPSDLNGPVRIYRFLLWFYPPGFRHRFGPDMLQVVQDSCRARDVRSAPRLALWNLTFSDLARSLPGEWWRALIRAGKIEIPIRYWADLVVIPFTVLGYLTVEGNMGAALIRMPRIFPWAHGCGDTWLLECTVGTGLAIAFTLAVLGVLSAIITAHNNRAEIGSIKL